MTVEGLPLTNNNVEAARHRSSTNVSIDKGIDQRTRLNRSENSKTRQRTIAAIV